MPLEGTFDIIKDAAWIAIEIEAAVAPEQQQAQNVCQQNPEPRQS
jgi:hypothetical protein